MFNEQEKMIPAQMASLLDAALCALEPVAFLDATVSMLRPIDRTADGTSTAWIGCLLAEGEVEVLIGPRAAWPRGEHRSPAEAAQRAVRCRLGVG